MEGQLTQDNAATELLVWICQEPLVMLQRTLSSLIHEGKVFTTQDQSTIEEIITDK